LAILVAWFVVIAVRRHGVDVTPHGGTMPRAPESTAYMPSSPAHGGAPATPGGTVNGPQQPLSSDAPPR
jgi:hypothetical protein